MVEVCLEFHSGRSPALATNVRHFINVPVKVGLEETDQGTGSVSRLLVGQVAVELANDPVGRFLHSRGSGGDLTQSGPALDHIPKRELCQIVHGKSSAV